MTPCHGPHRWPRPPPSLAWIIAVASKFASLVLSLPLIIYSQSRNHHDPVHHSSSHTFPFIQWNPKSLKWTKRPSVVCHPSHLSGSGSSVLSTLVLRHAHLSPPSSLNTPHLPPPLSICTSWLLCRRFPPPRHQFSSFPHFLLHEIHPQPQLTLYSQSPYAAPFFPRLL